MQERKSTGDGSRREGVVAWIAIAIASASLLISVYQAWQSTTMTRQDQRALVGLDNANTDYLPPWSIAPNAPIQLSFWFKNVGRTPALRMGIQRGYRLRAVADGEPNLSFEGHADGASLMMPGESNYVTITGSKPLTQAEADGFTQGRIAVYAYGNFHYSDVFDNDHVTEWCLRIAQVTPTRRAVAPCLAHQSAW
jgi:hypothetical protein